MQKFVELHPEFKDAAAALNVAVDLEYVTENAPILPGQEVAMFPPVSGG